MTSTPITIPISETFVSIQGEGKLTGVPSWFCRVSGCNLRCTWCDTPYASWEPEKTTRTIDELIREASESGVKHAVLTGGEPMMFTQLVELSQGLSSAGLHITIETAGTLTLPGVVCHLMSLSPKLANSTPSNDPRDPSGAWAARHEQRRLDYDAINELIASTRDRQLKFVVSDPADLDEIGSVLERLSGYEPGDVMLMPEGVTVPSPDEVAWVVDACVERGWSYCPRVHVQLFGDTRGT
ncbi:MAG: 7-carboxy-7-deazaguanine synthase QueE [Phycisphaerales bacterium]|nr:7-carboxy-7-deazaguanine synthase QueE [Phycisphaerales bacterium]